MGSPVFSDMPGVPLIIIDTFRDLSRFAILGLPKLGKINSLHFDADGFNTNSWLHLVSVGC